jgi:hypothetical protein
MSALKTELSNIRSKYEYTEETLGKLYREYETIRVRIERLEQKQMDRPERIKQLETKILSTSDEIEKNVISRLEPNHVTFICYLDEQWKTEDNLSIYTDGILGEITEAIGYYVKYFVESKFMYPPGTKRIEWSVGGMMRKSNPVEQIHHRLTDLGLKLKGILTGEKEVVNDG